MSDYITVRGFVATDPSIRMAQAGFPVGNFRLASTDRRFDRENNRWVDGATNWFTVNMFRNLAMNAGMSLQKGQPVVVTGRLKIRPWETEERSGIAVEVEADSIGHDLSLGTASFSRSGGRSGDATTTVAGASAGAGGEAGLRVNPETGELLEDRRDGGDEDQRDAGGEGTGGPGVGPEHDSLDNALDDGDGDAEDADRLAAV